MKTILSKLIDQIERRPDETGARSGRMRAMASRGLSMLVIALAVLLILDVGFIVVQTAIPSDELMPAAAGAQVTTVVLVTPAQPALSGTASPPAVAAQPQAATPAPPAPTATRTTPPRIAETPRERESKDTVAVSAAELCENPVGQLITDSIQSKVLGRSLQVHVYVPPCYDARKFVYPALYLIQGSAFRFGEWVQDGVPRIADLHMSLGILPPFIIVMPASDLEAGNASKYTYSVAGKGSWEDFMVHDLAPMIEAKYGAWNDREGRAIGGISRGGYWSLQIGFANPDKFSAVGGHSPSIMPDKLLGTPANFSMLSLSRSITELKTVRIFLDAGRTDWAQSGVKRLSSDLTARGITYTVSSGEGGHEDRYWASRVADYLAFYSAAWPRTALVRPANKGSAAEGARTQP